MRILQASTLEWPPCLPPRDLLKPGIEPRSPTLQADSLLFEPPGKPIWLLTISHAVPFISVTHLSMTHPFRCLLAICMSSLENIYSDPLPFFTTIGLFYIVWGFYVESYEFCILWILIPCRHIIYKHLLPFSRIIVVLLMIFFTVQVINLMLSTCLFLPLFLLPEKTYLEKYC